jgi:hypothetical protein
MAVGPNPLSLSAIHGLCDMPPSLAAKKKHLLRRMVKKVLNHDRRKIEVWYCLPNQASVRTADYLVPDRSRRLALSKWRTTGNIP